MGGATSTLQVVFRDRSEQKHVAKIGFLSNGLEATAILFLASCKSGEIKSMHEATLTCLQGTLLGEQAEFVPNRDRAALIIAMLADNESPTTIDTRGFHLMLDCVASPAALAYANLIARRALTAMQPNHSLRHIVLDPARRLRDTAEEGDTQPVSTVAENLAQAFARPSEYSSMRALKWDDSFQPFGTKHEAIRVYLRALHADGVLSVRTYADAAVASECFDAYAVAVACSEMGLPCTLTLRGATTSIPRTVRTLLKFEGVDAETARIAWGVAPVTLQCLPANTPLVQFLATAAQEGRTGALIKPGCDSQQFVNILAERIRKDPRFVNMRTIGQPVRIWAPVTTGVLVRAIQAAFCDTDVSEIIAVPCTAAAQSLPLYSNSASTASPPIVRPQRVSISGEIPTRLVSPPSVHVIRSILANGGSRPTDLVWLPK